MKPFKTTIHRDETLRHSRVAGKAAENHKYVARVKAPGGMSKYRYFYSQEEYEAWASKNRQDHEATISEFSDDGNEKSVTTATRNYTYEKGSGRKTYIHESTQKYSKTGHNFMLQLFGVPKTEWVANGSAKERNRVL